MPVSAEELARDAAACVATGARAVHLHPRDNDGRERLDADVVDSVVTRVRNACGVPVGVSTGAWTEPDLERRLRLVGAWRAPDYASVNVSEPGASEVMQALLPLYDPGGEPTAGNEALVRAARALGAGAE